MKDEGSYSRYFSLDSWWAERIKTLPEAMQKTFPFLIEPKANKAERGDGENKHPTVKPLQLMTYLITLGSRKGELVLDPFCGSGTTCLAANLSERKYIGIEISPNYASVAEKRLGSVL